MPFAPTLNVKWPSSGNSSERPALAPAIVTGALIGLAMLTRSEGTILLIILPIVAWLSRSTRGNWWRLAAALAACAVLVTPWVIRNAALLGRPVLSTNVVTLVAGANCGSTYYWPHLGDWRHCYAPLQPGPTAADEARWSSDLITRGLRYARKHASRVPVVVLARVMTVWSLGRLPSWDLPFGMSAPLHWIANLNDTRSTRAPPCWPNAPSKSSDPDSRSCT